MNATLSRRIGKRRAGSRIGAASLGVATWLGCLASASAQETAAPVVQVVGSLNDVSRAFLVVTALLAFLLLAGFCLLELGLTRAKNSINVVMKHLLGWSVVIVGFLFSFALMFGHSVEGWIGLGDWSYVTEGTFNGDFWVFWLGQTVLACAACAIAAQGLAERGRFLGYLVFCLVFAGILYPAVGHWAWGSRAAAYGVGGTQGWLELKGFHDFAGGSVVHGVGGACALAAMMAVGARAGRFGANGVPRLMVGHSVPLAGFGVLLIWLGSLSVHAGALGMPSADLGGVIVNTILAAAAGALAALLLTWILDGGPDAGAVFGGTVAGLASIAAGADVVMPLSALIIGGGGGLLAIGGFKLLERVGLDDPIYAVPSHLLGGLWGSLGLALFHKDGFGAVSLLDQAVGCLSLCLAAFSVAFVIFKAVDLVLGLRLSEEAQEDGLDFGDHAANAYPDFVTVDHERLQAK